MNDAAKYLNNLRKFKNAVDKYLLPGLWDKTLRAAAEQITMDKLEKIKDVIDDGQNYVEQMRMLEGIDLPSIFASEYKMIRISKFFDDDFFVNLSTELKKKLKNKEEFYEKYEDEQHQYYFSLYVKDGEYCTSFAVESKNYEYIERYYLLNSRHALYAYDEVR